MDPVDVHAIPDGRACRDTLISPTADAAWPKFIAIDRPIRHAHKWNTAAIVRGLPEWALEKRIRPYPACRARGTQPKDQPVSNLRVLIRRKDCSGRAVDRVWPFPGDLLVGGGAAPVKAEMKVGPVAADGTPPPEDRNRDSDGHDEPSNDWPQPRSQCQHGTSPYGKRGQ